MHANISLQVRVIVETSAAIVENQSHSMGQQVTTQRDSYHCVLDHEPLVNAMLS